MCTGQRWKERQARAASGSSPGTVRAVVVPEVALLAMGPISLPELPPLVPGPGVGGNSELRPGGDHG